MLKPLSYAIPARLPIALHRASCDIFPPSSRNCRKYIEAKLKLDNLPAGAIDWSKFSSSTNLGKSGTATTRVRELGKIQLRLVDFSSKYVADHWCHKSHIMFVVSGRVVIEHQDGPKFTLSPGMSYHVSDDSGAPHRISSRSGASIFIVDL